MTIVADSGSTKTTWIDVDSGNKIVTEGLNPHLTSDEQFNKVICKVVDLLGTPQKVFFYGAGCGSSIQQNRAKYLLTEGFYTDNVQVETDMLGACRAVCGDQPGLVGILGTGSNACYFDGSEIKHQAVSTGYILGDEGSANYVGRRLLQDYLTGIMPEPINTIFHEAYPFSREEFMDAVYHQPHPNRFLASLAPFALEHINEQYCSMVITISLIDWNNYQLEDLWEQTLCGDLYLVGGFASRIKRSLLDRFAKDHDLVIRKILADPIDGLREYHQNTIHYEP